MSESTTTTTNIIEIQNPGPQRDSQILNMRLSGMAIREIGRAFRMTDKAVTSSIDRALPSIGSDRARPCVPD